MPDSRPFLTLACAVLVGALGGCKPEPLVGEGPVGAIVATQPAGDETEPRVDPVLMTVGGVPLTVEEFERMASRLSDLSQRKLNTVQGRNGLLQMFLWMQILAVAAEREGLAGGAEEVLQIEEARARAALDAHSAGTVDREALDATLEGYYEARRSDFVTPEQRRVYGIVVESEDKARQVHAEVETALEHARASLVIERLAGVYSIHEPSRSEGGFYGWLVSNADGASNDPALDAAIFGMRDVGLGPVVQTSRGWEIFVIGAIREPRNLGLDDVRRTLSEERFHEAVGADQRAELDAARVRLGAVVDRVAVGALAEQRASEPPEPHRPRRYSQAALAKDPVAELGDAVLDALAAEQAALRANPATAPAPTLAEPAEPAVAPETDPR